MEAETNGMEQVHDDERLIVWDDVLVSQSGMTGGARTLPIRWPGCDLAFADEKKTDFMEPSAPATVGARASFYPKSTRCFKVAKAETGLLGGPREIYFPFPP